MRLILLSVLFLIGCGRQVDIELGEIRSEFAAIKKSLDGDLTCTDEPIFIKREAIRLRVVCLGSNITPSQKSLEKALAEYDYDLKVIKKADLGEESVSIYCNSKVAHRYVSWVVQANRRAATLTIRATGFDQQIPDCSVATKISP